MLFAFTFFKPFQTQPHFLYYIFFSVMCSVKREHNPNASSGSVAVGGKFSDWFKILQCSKPIDDWQVPLKAA